MKYRKIFVIVLDSLGIGGINDANTFKRIVDGSNLDLPNLRLIGLYDLIDMINEVKPMMYYTKAKITNPGLESIGGHYEMMGIKTTAPYLKFETFPDELIKEIEKIANKKVIANRKLSHREMLDAYGKESINNDNIIIYTSNDSVMEVAAHEKVMAYEDLFKLCSKIRELTLTKKEWQVQRVIARPFTGSNTIYELAIQRKDYSINPPSKSILTYLRESGYETICIGKISDMFNGVGVTRTLRTSSNTETIFRILNMLKTDFTGLCFANLNDFDSLGGHRRDIKGYVKLLTELETNLPYFVKYCTEDDLLIFTADHGCDPIVGEGNHTDEMVPVIMYSKYLNDPKELEPLESLTDIAATIAENFDVNNSSGGKSFLDLID